MIDGDTRETVEAGRQRVRDLLTAVRDDLRKAFVVFAAGLVATVVGLQQWGWDFLRKEITMAHMDAATATEFEVYIRTPFDVILLQAKIGLVVGAILAIPVLLYLSRGKLKERGLWPRLPIPRWKLAGLAVMAFLLFMGGMTYAYYIFFPVMFNFLASYTIQIGFAPKFDLVMWTDFIILLTVSFGLAAQLPLAMSALSYSGIVTYETFRDKWRYAVLGIFVFGAFFSPPDPFTQLMWATPLVGLYAASLYLAKFFTAAGRGGSTQMRAKLRANWNRIAAAFVLFATGIYYFLELGYVEGVNAAIEPVGYRIALEGLALSGTELHVALAAVWGALLALPFLFYYVSPELEPPAHMLDPSDIDIDELDVSGVETAQPEVFEELEENEALAHAQNAMDDDDPEKARAILDRFDAVTGDEEADETVEEDSTDVPTADARVSEDGETGGGSSPAETAQSAAATVVDEFTEEDTDEDDIGGYYYDLRFIFESLTSKAFRVVGVFIATIAVTFLALYQGGFKMIQEDFLARLPEEVVDEEAIQDSAEDGADGTAGAGGTDGGANGAETAEMSELVDIVALHPVEAILFEVKMSVIAGIIVTLPLVLYYAWPAIEQRFYGITREYDTEPPIAEIKTHWNQVVGVIVLGAGAAYYALTEGFVELPFDTVYLPAEEITSVGSLEGLALTLTVAFCVGLVAATPVAAFHAYESIVERIRHGGKRNVFLYWGGSLLFAVIVGSVIGYMYIAPTIISYLVYDALRAGMVIAYRINSFFWLVFATTAGIGLLASIPMTMWLFHRGGIVSFETMWDRWRGIVIVIFAISAVLSPSSMLTMFLVAVPVSIAYLIGLAGLWLVTLPWRVRDRVVELVGSG